MSEEVGMDKDEVKRKPNLRPWNEAVATLLRDSYQSLDGARRKLEALQRDYPSAWTPLHEWQLRDLDLATRRGCELLTTHTRNHR